MRPYLYSAFVILITQVLFSCNPKNSEPALSDNASKTDSAFFISSANGDTVYTNVPFQLEGEWKDTAKYKMNSAYSGVSFRTEKSPKYQYIFDSVYYNKKPVYYDSLEITTPGEDTFDLPVTETYEPKIVLLQASVPTAVSPLRRKENARVDIQYLNTESGLPSSYITALLFTRDGIMWLGTQKGLCRFDGKFVTSYTSENGLPDEMISRLFEDSKGNIWIGTQYGGVAKYDGTNLMILDDQNGLPKNSITAIDEDSHGNIWLSMWGGGISKFDGQSVTTFDREQGLFEMRVLNLAVDEKDVVWVATNGKGLYSYDGKSIRHHGQKFGTNDGYLISLFNDSQGRLWIGNWSDMRYLTADSLVGINYPVGAKTGQVAKMVEDSKGNIWFASMQNGVFRYDGKSVMNISELGGLPSNSVVDVAEDPSGNMWFATEGGGLCRYNPNSFDYFDESAGLNSKVVNAITEMEDGRMIFATDKGVVFFDDTSFLKLYIKDNEKEESSKISEVYRARNNDIWFSGMNHAIFRIWNDSIRVFGRNQGIHDHNISAICERGSGELWMGAINVGSARLNEKGITVFNARSGLHNFIINDLFTDQQQTLWIATDGEGITRYDGTHFMHITENEGLLSNHVNSFYEDSFHNLWILGKKGINLLINGKVERFDLANLLPDKNVVSAIQDKDKNYWIFTANGMLYLKLKENVQPTTWNPENYDARLFTQFDGLLGADFIPRSVFIDSKNRIWFGTGKGLMMKNLSSFDVTPKAPEISLETIKLNGNFVDYNNFTDSIYDSLFTNFEALAEGIKTPEKFKNIPAALTLPPNVNHLTFMFSAKSWHSDKIRFSYRLVGVDEKWSQPSKDAWAEYRNLSYGEYTFQVKGIGEANVESAVLEYHFTILPPWYHTWWARLIFIVIIILGVRFFVRLRTRQLELKQVALENKVQERTAELDVKNKALVSQNSIIEEQRIEAENRKEEIEKQHTLLEETHKEIKDSINYAKRIQEAILPTADLINQLIPQNFVLYKPKDVVAGDFYWIQQINDGILFSSSDCTGHGVPGAMVSVVCYNALNRSVREFGQTSPEKVLDKTREIVLETFQRNNAQVNDGMDAAIISLRSTGKNATEKLLEFSGANSSVIIIRNGEMTELEGDKQPVGNYKDAKPFQLHTFTLLKGDTIYLFTDGYADQFGGPKGKKLKSKVLKELLVAISPEPLHVQKEKLLHHLEEWKGDLEQLDDISVFGFRI
ncbi:MAG: SpoIIE family protein phosphatase [Bacteroidetes bacterium]|nr:SpoIIE family protein phosphatase [Bacteroidota bacterium]